MMVLRFSRRLILATLLTAASVAMARAETIGLSLPLTGRFSTIAERMEFGAQLALTELRKTKPDLAIALADQACNNEEAPDIAPLKGVRIVIGPLCFDTARAVASALNGENDAPVPVITYATRNPQLQRLRERDGLPLYSLSAAPDAEARAVVEELLPRFGSRPYAIIDDGSVYGRGLADSVRALAEEAGRPPVTTADFRPLQTTQLALLRRLARSGIQAVFIAAGPEDVVTIVRDLGSLDFDWLVGTGEPSILLRFTEGAGQIGDGLLAVAPEDLSLDEASQLAETLAAEEVEVEDALLVGYALMQVAAQYLVSDVALSEQDFETIIGPIRFGEDGRADPAPFRLKVWQDGRFSPATNGE